jgi:hypothetical protein
MLDDVLSLIRSHAVPCDVVLIPVVPAEVVDHGINYINNRLEDKPKAGPIIKPLDRTILKFNPG